MPSAIAATLPLLPEQKKKEYVAEFVIGGNTSAAILEDEMAKLDACRIRRLDVGQWGRATCYATHDWSCAEFRAAFVCEARKWEVDYIKK